MNIIDKWLPENSNVFIFVIQFLLVVVRGGESLPRQGINKQRMFLEVLFEGVLLRYNSGIVIVIDIDIVAVVLQTVVVTVRMVVCGRTDGGRGHLVFTILNVIQLFIGEIVQGEVTIRCGRINRTPLTRTEAEHGAHAGQSRRCRR